MLFELHRSLEEQQGVLLEQPLPVAAHGVQVPPLVQMLVDGLQQSEVAMQRLAPLMTQPLQIRAEGNSKSIR